MMDNGIHKSKVYWNNGRRLPKCKLNYGITIYNTLYIKNNFRRKMYDKAEKVFECNVKDKTRHTRNCFQFATNFSHQQIIKMQENIVKTKEKPPNSYIISNFVYSSEYRLYAYLRRGNRSIPF